MWTTGARRWTRSTSTCRTPNSSYWRRRRLRPPSRGLYRPASAGPSWPGPRSRIASPSISPPRPTSRPSRSSPSSAGPCAPSPRPCRPGSALPSGPMRRCAMSGVRRTSAPPRPRPAPPARACARTSRTSHWPCCGPPGCPRATSPATSTRPQKPGSARLLLERATPGWNSGPVTGPRPTRPASPGGQSACPAGPRPRLRRRASAVRHLLRPGGRALCRHRRGHPARLSEPRARRFIPAPPAHAQSSTPAAVRRRW